MNESIGHIVDSLFWLLDYLEKHDHRGLEPYNISDLRYFDFAKRGKTARLLLTQLLRLCPSEAVWRSLGARECEISKAMILFALGYLNLYRVFGQQLYLDRACRFLDWICENRSQKYANFCIGSNFDLQMKSYCASKDSPSPMLTAYAVDTLLDAFELTGESKFFNKAVSGIDFLLNDLPVMRVDDENIYFSYVPDGFIFVPNLTAIIAGTLAHYHKFASNEHTLSYAMKALRYVVKAQLPDGSWPYVLSLNYVDSFHSGFVLEALYKYQKYTGQNDFEAAFWKGLEFYENTFFSNGGVPRHKVLLGVPKNADSLLTRIDIRDCAQGVVLFSRLSQFSKSYLDLARRLALWTTDNFQDKEGYFYYQKTLFHSIKVPFIRSQAWMLYALGHLLSSCGESNQREKVISHAE